MPRKGGVPENLKPFPKGVSGNPKGGKHKLPELNVLLAKVLGQEANGQTLAERIIISLANTALKGKGAEKNRAAEILINRGYGMPKQKLEHEGQAISITFVPNGSNGDLPKPASRSAKSNGIGKKV
jgi:hypothetical protein